jgi:hypothetical protein
MSAGRGWCLTATVLLAGALAGPANAADITLSLTSSNGQGTFDASLPCSTGGDGPSWRYAYSGLAAAPKGSPLAGTWDGTVEVHQSDLSGSGGAYVPSGTGRTAIQNSRGSGDFLFSAGSCGSPMMSLGFDETGDPIASGTLPLIATGGTGSLRDLTGSGSVSTSFVMGPGADNEAVENITGTFHALAPALAVGQPNAFWGNLTNYLNRNLRVTIPVFDGGPPTSVGDAFSVTISSATLGGLGGASGGVPGSLGQINSGNGSAATVVFHGARPGQTYNLSVTVTAQDALNDQVTPLTVSRSVTVPLLP